MVDRTSTGNAPWTLVEANDKNYARIKILRTLCERLEAALARSPKVARKKQRLHRPNPASQPKGSGADAASAVFKPVQGQNQPPALLKNFQLGNHEFS